VSVWVCWALCAGAVAAASPHQSQAGRVARTVRQRVGDLEWLMGRLRMRRRGKCTLSRTPPAFR